MNQAPEPLWTLKELSAWLSVSKPTAWRLGREWVREKASERVVLVNPNMMRFHPDGVKRWAKDSLKEYNAKSVRARDGRRSK